MHERSASRLLNREDAGGGSCRIGRRATVVLLTLGLVALGVHIGLMIDIAHSDREQAAAAAPTAHGSGAMAFCVIRGRYRGSYTSNMSTGHPELPYVPVQATLPSDVTKALGKGCTLAGTLVQEGSSGTEGASAVAVQPMLCPTAMVGATPASFSKSRKPFSPPPLPPPSLPFCRKGEVGCYGKSPSCVCATGSTCHPTAGDCSDPPPVFHEGNVGECLV